MPLVVNTNLDSINAQRNLSMVNFELSKTFLRLSSGKRINTAGDDAAGLAFVNQFETDIRGAAKLLTTPKTPAPCSTLQTAVPKALLKTCNGCAS
ncbi:MAG: hypothetical protein R2857_07485 [Vampirovibrionales bacterium]